MNTQFLNDLKKGEKAVNYFTHYLDKYNIQWRPATPQEQANGIDIVTTRATYEIKHQTKQTQLIIEESSTSGKGSGWIYTSDADYLISVSFHLKIPVIKKFDMKKLRDYFLKTRDQHCVIPNSKKSDGIYHQIWRSGYYEYDMEEVEANI